MILRSRETGFFEEGQVSLEIKPEVMTSFGNFFVVFLDPGEHCLSFVLVAGIAQRNMETLVTGSFFGASLLSVFKKVDCFVRVSKVTPGVRKQVPGPLEKVMPLIFDRRMQLSILKCG